MSRLRVLALIVAVGSLILTPARSPAADDPPPGVVPVDEAGRPLNLGFEAGDLRDWTAEGTAFAGQPIEGDVVQNRRGDMQSRHVGRFWVGTYERNADPATGTLTSRPFKVTHPFASFLVGGGFYPETRVEIVRQDTGQVIDKVSGEQVGTTEGAEDMRRAVVDLTPHLGKTVFVRVVDGHRGHWGHINFDDFRFHATRPVVPPRVKPPAPDVIANAGLAPEAAAKAMTVPEGFRVTLFAGEPDVVQPIALTLDDRGRLWVAEAYSYPRRVKPEEARDRILIFEDSNGDGRFDTRKVFADKLNLVSGLEVGFGGVWVGAAPELLFIPDADGDDRPDGPPRVLLDGWGLHDTHETLNSFAWGPDGWLYGCHGVFTQSRVGKPGTPEAERVPINAGIWRYHPKKNAFEVFAHGTSNPWGIDWDENGQAFLTACVIPHLYHVIPGARYERQGGSHDNPYTYDDIKTIADHRHYVGGSPHGGNGRSDSAGGGHAHAGALIYLGGAWPAEYRGSIFMNNIHGARLNRDTLKPTGSGSVGSHAPDFLLTNDRWSQIISLKSGPDGNVYMIDWYDKNQCHDNNVVAHDRTNGRIFKVSYGASKPIPGDQRTRSGPELIALLTQPNEWLVRHALRILSERGPDPELREALAGLAASQANAAGSLRGLWALHETGNLDEAAILGGLAHTNPHVRAWAIRLAVEDRAPSTATLARFAAMAKTDPSPVVRLALASALQRVALKDRWDILEGLSRHAEDAADPNLPLMIWYAAEPLAELDAGRALGLALASPLPKLPDFMVRRVSAIGSPGAIALLVEVGLIRAPSPARRLLVLRGINEALKGRRQVPMPPSWPEAFAGLIRDADPEVRSQATALAVTFGDPKALEALRGVLANASADRALRVEALESLLKAHAPDLSPALRRLLSDPAVRAAALRGLAAYDDPETPGTILQAYSSLSPAERRDALNTLASRADFARKLLAAVAAKTVPAADLTADLVRQMRNLKSRELDEQIAQSWGSVRDTPADRAREIARMKGMLTAKPAIPPDLNLGRAVFTKTCAQCHTLFGVGGKVGPELTGSNRADLDYLLANVLDPSALIGKDYLAHVVATRDGRVLTGIIRAEDKDAITLVTANETLVIPRSEVEQSKPSDQSMMPEGLWQPLSEPEIRSMVAYLAAPAQVPTLATAETIRGFFDGRTLAGWQGDPKLWSVQGGEIVGRSTGLARNEFLRGDLVFDDFSLTLKVKLVDDRGNSGIQFRSEALPGDEVKGYQADVGPGWWGKLYEENGRGLLWKDSAEAHVRPGEWNEYAITARGGKIETRINGHPAVDLDDPAGARRGIFAFQLHAGGPTEVRFKDFRIELHPGSARFELPPAREAKGEASR